MWHLPLNISLLNLMILATFSYSQSKLCSNVYAVILIFWGLQTIYLFKRTPEVFASAIYLAMYLLKSQ